MVKAWLASVAVGAMTLFGSSTTGDHRPPRVDDRQQGSSTEIRDRDHFSGRSASSTGLTIDIPCVAAGVAAREASLGSAMTAFTTDSNTAYTKRASDLASAYTQSGQSAVRSAVRSAWQHFSAARTVAKKAWQSSRDSAWSQFKTAVRSCGSAAASLSDSGNASSESSGQ